MPQKVLDQKLIKINCQYFWRYILFSFNANKVITAGGGGALITNNKKIADRAYYLSIQAKDNSKYFIHNDIGYNYRMTNLHAAIGLAQLEKINLVMKLKKNIIKIFKLFKKNTDFSLLYKNKDTISKYNCWMNILTINKKNLNVRKLINYMEKNGVDVRPVWKLNHLQKKYENCEKFEISKAIKLVSRSICLPSSSNLSLSQINKISNLINNYII